jgi:hypothetical protein
MLVFLLVFHCFKTNLDKRIRVMVPSDFYYLFFKSVWRRIGFDS